MKSFLIPILIILSFFELSCQESTGVQKIFFGDEILLKEKLDLIRNKRLGIVTNHSAVLPNNVHLVDTLISLGIDIRTLFSPEHGIIGNISAGKKISSSTDSITGISVISLYGENKKPTEEMLSNIDVLIFDIQDVGVRFYTYISTLYYILESAGENNIPLIILDRPDPLSGEMIDGPVLQPEYKSFIGIAPIPILYGMTTGELAKYFIEENIINKPAIEVIKIKGWHRDDYWDDLDREWIPTSPNIPKFETALIYPGICLIEGTNVSEGRGTDNPFLTLGAPFINSDELAGYLNSLEIPGVKISGTSFVPVEILGKALNPKYVGIECFGIKVEITNKRKFKPVEFGIMLLHSLLQIYPESFKFRNDHFDLLAGSDKLRKELLAGKSPSEIIKGWQPEINNYNSIRKKYLMY